MRSMDERIAKLTPAQRKLLEKKMTQMSRKKSEVLLTLQEGDMNRKRPIFFAHPPLGVSGYFINLVRYLNPDQPAYGIQCPALLQVGDPFDCYEDMAAYYLDVIRSVQPDPPYVLAGHSSGAFTVYEMALQLENNIKSVPYLFLIDAKAPLGTINPMLEAYHAPNLLESNEVMFVTTWMVSLAHNLELSFTLEDLQSCSTLDQKYELVTNFLKKAGFLPQRADITMVKTVLQMIAKHTEADKRYYQKHTPNGSEKKFQGHAVLFRSTEETRWPGFDFVSPVDISEFSGWEKFCSGIIDVIDIPKTDHITIMMEPRIKALAEHLQSYLDQVTPL